MHNFKLMSLNTLYKLMKESLKEEFKEKNEKEITEIIKEKLTIFFLDFKCKKNEDIEDFIRTKCIEFHIKNYARTFFILNDEDEIVAYYTLAFKALVLNEEHKMSSKVRSKINFKKYRVNNEDVKIANCILIAQLGRNDKFTREEITLEDIMNYTVSTITKIREMIGTSIVLIEVDKEEKLIKRYVDIGFTKIGTEKEMTQLMKLEL